MTNWHSMGKSNTAKRKSKTELIFVVQGNYGNRWEDVTAEENWKEGKARLKDYDDNEKCYPHRMIRRRIKKE